MRAHLFHDFGAMDFDSALTQPQIDCRDFVGVTSNDHVIDPPFPR
jgi:hypothetical protein